MSEWERSKERRVRRVENGLCREECGRRVRKGESRKSREDSVEYKMRIVNKEQGEYRERSAGRVKRKRSAERERE